jgi:hypothetical protein
VWLRADPELRTLTETIKQPKILRDSAAAPTLPHDSDPTEHGREQLRDRVDEPVHSSIISQLLVGSRPRTLIERPRDDAAPSLSAWKLDVLTPGDLASRFRSARETGIQPRVDRFVAQLELQPRQLGDNAVAEVHHYDYRREKPKHVAENRGSEIERPRASVAPLEAAAQRHRIVGRFWCLRQWSLHSVFINYDKSLRVKELFASDCVRTPAPSVAPHRSMLPRGCATPHFES